MLCIFPDGKKSPKLFVTGVVLSFSFDARDTKYLLNSFAITRRSMILSLLMIN